MTDEKATCDSCYKEIEPCDVYFYEDETPNGLQIRHLCIECYEKQP